MNSKNQVNTLTGKSNGKDSEIIARQQNFEGPLPHPEILAGYEEVLSGGAERIFSMSEKEQEHRHSIARQELENKSYLEKSNMKLVKVGLIFAFVICFLVIVSGIVLLYIGKSISGFGLLLSPLAVLVGAFIYGNKQTKK